MRHHEHCSRARGTSGTQSGFTLFEVLIATAIVGTAVVASSWSLTMVGQSKAARADEANAALELAAEIRQLASALTREPSGTVGVTSAADLAALDSLEGAVFSPPLRADRSTAAGFTGWTQRVDLAVYDTQNLSVETSDDPTLGIRRGSSNLYQLRVTIEDQGTVQGTYRWWLSP